MCVRVCISVCVVCCVCVCVSFCANKNNVLRRSKIYLIANKEDTVSPVHLRSLIRLIFFSLQCTNPWNFNQSAEGAGGLGIIRSHKEGETE